MIKNFLTVTIRNLWRDKFGSLINIIGFSTGLAAFLIIIAYVRQETSFEKFNEKADRIFRVNLSIAIDGKPKIYTVSADIIGPRMKEVAPEVENYVRVFWPFNMPVYLQIGDDIKTVSKFYFADSTLFDVFTIHMLNGTTKGLLANKNDLIISESAAIKYFGTTDIEGKMVKIQNSGNYIIKGVFRDFPPTSHLRPELIAPFMNNPMYHEMSWEGANYFTYLLLRSADDKDKAEKKLQEIFNKEMAANLKAPGMMYSLFPIRDIHLYSKADFEPEPTGDIKQVEIFMAIAVFILLLAVVNYVNMTTSKSIERAREVGLRKILGSFRIQIIWQFLGESALITLIATSAALLMVYIFIPYVNGIFQRNIDISFLFSMKYLAMIAGLWVFLSVLSGFYPSVLLSMFQPAYVMKGTFKRSKHGILLRKFLVTFQFIISSSIIVGTLIIYRQLNYMQDQDLGFDKDKLVVISPSTNLSDKEFDLSAFKKQILGNMNVAAVSLASAYPTHNLGGQLVWGEGMEANRTILMWTWETDEDFIQTLGLKLIAGKNMNPEKKDRKDLDFVINETGMKQLGWNIDNSIGKRIKMGEYREGICAGVVKDFHFASLKSKIEPLILCKDNGMPKNILVRVEGKDIRATMKYIENQWKSVNSSAPFEYHFLDEQYNALYKNEISTGRFFVIFAVLAIIIACLGLFALSTFESLTRTKEIGIRKALGSTELGIFGLLVKDFSIQVFLSFIISIPVSWYLMNNWLESYAYRISISPVIFIIGGIIILLITILTIGYHSLRAAFRNPV